MKTIKITDILFEGHNHPFGVIAPH